MFDCEWESECEWCGLRLGLWGGASQGSDTVRKVVVGPAASVAGWLGKGRWAVGAAAAVAVDSEVGVTPGHRRGIVQKLRCQKCAVSLGKVAQSQEDECSFLQIEGASFQIVGGTSFLLGRAG